MNSMGLVNPTAEDLSDLARRRSGEVVSLLLPPLPVPEARLTLRNLAKAAVHTLEERGHKATAARTMLAPVDAILDQHHWWTGPATSLAIYLDGDDVVVMPGPGDGAPRTVVAPQFHIVHLLAVHSDERHAVLVMGKKSAQLYRSGDGGLDEVRSGGFPVVMDEVLRFDDREPQLQSHSSARRGAGRVVAAFHGQGGKSDQSEDELRYLRVVAAAVEGVLQGEPVVLAATDENAAAFRKVTHYSNVVEQSIAGSAEHFTPHELSGLAAPVVAELELAAMERRVRTVTDAAAEGQSASDVAEMLGAAVDGRIASLVLAEDAEVWGIYDPTTRNTAVGDAGGEDLLNFVAVETWRHGGDVYFAPATLAVFEGPATALLRY